MHDFFEEMKRRKVFRSVTAYAVVAFIIMQLVEIVFPIFDIPNWAGRMVIILLFMGFPIVMLLSWMFDITREGVIKDDTQLVVKETGVISGFNLQVDNRQFYQKKRSWFVFVGILVGLTIGVIFTKDFSIKQFLKSPGKSLAVVSFQNLSEDGDQSRIGQILQELIITDLSDIPLLKVFSSQRLFDVQKQLGLRDNRSIDPAMALDVAKVVGASSMLTGNIIDRGLIKVLTSRLIRVDDGSVIRSHSVEGNNIYDLIDKLTGLVKGDLNIAEKGLDLEIKQKTTESIAAFKYYLEGMEMLNDNHYEEAVIKLEKALEIDGSFNEALYSLAIAVWWRDSQSLNEADPAQDPNNYLRKILDGNKVITPEFREKVEATVLLIDRKWNQALATFEKLVQKYPQEKDLWYNLGECYYHSEGFNLRALDAFEKTLKLDPEYTLAYTHIFDIYYNEKMFDRSINLARLFIGHRPDSPQGYLAMSRAYIVKGDIAKAKLNLQFAKSNDQNDFRIDLERIRLAQIEENYSEAMKIIESLLNKSSKMKNNKLLEILNSIRIEQGQYTRSILAMTLKLEQMKDEETGAKNHLNLVIALNAFYMNDMDSFNDYMSRVDHDNMPTESYLRFNLYHGLANFHQNNVAELVKNSNDIITKINSTGYEGDLRYGSDFLLGLIQIQKQELDEAEIILTGRIMNAPVWQDIITIYLADLYLEKENPEKALELSQKMLSPSVDQSVYNTVHPRGYYIKGKALEKLGRYKEAVEAYDHLLKIWVNADSTIPELMDTKIRLKNLKALDSAAYSSIE